MTGLHADKNAEAVLNELNGIDRCFVNNDTDGINEIMKRAEANPALSNWNKLRIVNECKLALFDLRMYNGLQNVNEMITPIDPDCDSVNGHHLT